jgi:hypothetical protein
VTHARNCLYLEGDWQCAGGCTYDADEHLRTVTAERDAALAKLAAVEAERADDIDATLRDSNQRAFDGVVSELRRAEQERDAAIAHVNRLHGQMVDAGPQDMVVSFLEQERDEARAALAAIVAEYDKALSVGDPERCLNWGASRDVGKIARAALAKGGDRG